MVMTSFKHSGDVLGVRALVDSVSDPNARTVEAMIAAVDACDYVHAAQIALSRACNGEPVPADAVAGILPGVRDAKLVAGLCSIASGDRAAAWLACLRERRFPTKASPIEAVVLFAAWRAGATSDVLAPEARRLARMSIGYGGFALLYTLATELGDANLREATRHLRITSQWGSGPDYVASIDRVLRSSVGEILDALSVEALTQPVATGYTIRVAPRAGRNDPCPCGSGRKFKRCCADAPQQGTPSPVPGLSWDEYVARAADKMSADDIRGLPLREHKRSN
jgi:hypothetical protein